MRHARPAVPHDRWYQRRPLAVGAELADLRVCCWPFNGPGRQVTLRPDAADEPRSAAGLPLGATFGGCLPRPSPATAAWPVQAPWSGRGLRPYSLG